MKRFYLYLSMALTALWTGCTADDEMTTWRDDPDAVIIKATVGGLDSRSNPAGDLLNQNNLTQFNEGDKIYIRSNNDATVAYTLTDGKWEPEAGKYLKWISEGAYFSVYYPYIWNGNSTPTVKDQSDLEKLQKADFMFLYYGTTKIPDNRILELSLARQTARIVITVNHFYNQFETGEKVTDIRLFGDCIPYRLEGDGSAGTKYVFLAPRQDSSDKEFIAVTTSSGVIAKKLMIPQLRSCTSYSYDLNIGKDRLDIANVSVTDWTDGGVIPDGNLSEVFDLDLDYYNKSGQDLEAVLRANIKSDCNIKVTGTWDDKNFDILENFLTDNPFRISLDLSKVTGLTDIPDSAFYPRNGSSGLYGIVLPPSVTSIGRGSFLRTNISSIDLTHVTSVGYKAFQSCYELADITWPVQECTFTKSAFNGTAWSGSYEKRAAPFTLPLTVVYANDDDEANRGFFNGGRFEQITIPAGFKGTYEYLMQSVDVKTLVIEGDVDIPVNLTNNSNVCTLDISNCSKYQDLGLFTLQALQTVYVKTKELKEQYENSLGKQENAKHIKFIVKGNE